MSVLLTMWFISLCVIGITLIITVAWIGTPRKTYPQRNAYIHVTPRLIGQIIICWIVWPLFITGYFITALVFNNWKLWKKK